MATSSTLSLGRFGLRCSSSRMHRTTRSSARVWAYMPFSPALPNGVRTPSTKTTSESARGTVPPDVVLQRSGRDYCRVTSGPTGPRVTILTTMRPRQEPGGPHPKQSKEQSVRPPCQPTVSESRTDCSFDWGGGGWVSGRWVLAAGERDEGRGDG